LMIKLIWALSDPFTSQVPVLNDVRDITIAKGGKGALVSYENKV
jgi:hypothetical protein